MAGLLLKRALVVRRMGRFRGDPGFLGNLVKGIGKGISAVAKVALPVARVVPGLGTVAGIVGGAASIIGSGGRAGLPKLPQAPTNLFKPGSAHALRPDFSNVVSGKSSTSPFRRRRRMNPMNHKAANRAIRRIKAVRKIVRSIESSLPKQRATAHRVAHRVTHK